jgi:predicted AlkP superfamily pyrophosphatase or phosphodiesterase
MILRLLLFCLVCSLARAASAPAAPLILISLDGFRWDYCDLYPNESPTLRRLKREGVSARGLIPVFPSNTFPNHYTIVTGLYPSKHGIINNEFFDGERGLLFRYNLATAVADPKWWGGEPIWVTAIKQGHKAAAAFWVGSEAEVAGVRPTFWQRYDYAIPFDRRLEELVGWLKLPPDQRPIVVTFYLEETNGEGHRFGPSSPQLIAAVKLVDQRVATMLARLRAEGVDPNLVIVSDHGMTETSADRTVLIEDFVDLASVQIDAQGSAMALRPNEGDVASLLRALEKIPHARVFRAEDLPAHFKITPGPRVAPVWIVAEEGWHVVTRAQFEKYRARYPHAGYLPGDHGYDPNLPSMRGIFIASGPAFRRGVEIPEVENIHIYNLLCAALKLKPAPNDGDDRLVKAALRE